MDSNFAKEANSADAVWNLLGRSSGVGRKLFNLYSQGDSRATNIGNYYSCQNRAKHLKKLAKGYKPTKQGIIENQWFSLGNRISHTIYTSLHCTG